MWRSGQETGPCWGAASKDGCKAFWAEHTKWSCWGDSGKEGKGWGTMRHSRSGTESCEGATAMMVPSRLGRPCGET